MPTDLHLALQQHYAGEDGVVEAPVGRYRADVLVGEVVYEIQTASVTAIRDKLRKLARKRPVVLVCPVPARKIIVRVDPETGEEVSARRSPKRGAVTDAFLEMPYIARLLGRGGVALEVAMVVERELRCDDGKGSWRRRGVSIVGRELVEVLERHRFGGPADYLRLLPDDLPRRFTVRELAAAAGIKRWLAGRMAYTMRHCGALRTAGKRGRALLYQRAPGMCAEEG